jgi:hypothetical protein
MNQYTIAVYPHVKKFMIKRFPHSKTKVNGLDQPVFNTEEYNTLGKLVTLCLLDKRGWNGATFKQHDDYGDKLTETIIIKVSKNQERMTPRKYKFNRLNIDIDRLFKEAMITWITAQIQLGHPIRTACSSFLTFHDINPEGKEYNLDTAYQNWKRSKIET